MPNSIELDWNVSRWTTTVKGYYKTDDNLEQNQAQNESKIGGDCLNDGDNTTVQEVSPRLDWYYYLATS